MSRMSILSSSGNSQRHSQVSYNGRVVPHARKIAPALLYSSSSARHTLSTSARLPPTTHPQNPLSGDRRKPKRDKIQRSLIEQLLKGTPRNTVSIAEGRRSRIPSVARPIHQMSTMMLMTKDSSPSCKRSLVAARSGLISLTANLLVRYLEATTPRNLLTVCLQNQYLAWHIATSVTPPFLIVAEPARRRSPGRRGQRTEDILTGKPSHALRNGAKLYSRGTCPSLSLTLQPSSTTLQSRRLSPSDP